MADSAEAMSQNYFLPRALKYYLNRMTNFSTQKVRITPFSSQTFNPNDQIIIQFPSNSLVRLDTLSLYGNITTTGTTVSPPRHIETIIEQVYFDINGVSVQPGFTSYGNLWKALADFQGLEDRLPLRSILNNHNTPTSLSGFTNLAEQPFAISQWLGILGSYPVVLDTSVLGDCRAVIRIAPATCLGTTATSATASYKLDTVYASFENIALEDQVFYSILARRLASGIPLEVPFDNYYTIMGGSGSDKISA